MRMLRLKSILKLAFFCHVLIPWLGEQCFSIFMVEGAKEREIRWWRRGSAWEEVEGNEGEGGGDEGEGRKVVVEGLV